MPYYHVYINMDGDETEELDLSKEQLMKHITKPHNQHKKFLCGGMIVIPSEIMAIKVIETEQSSSKLLPQIRAKKGMFRVLYNDFSLLEESGRDVTREFVKITSKTQKKKTLRKKISIPTSNNVFIVHGRHHEPMKELKEMLKEFGLNPIVLQELPGGSMTIIEKLEKYSEVGFAFAILTPDDVGFRRSRFQSLLRTATFEFDHKKYFLEETIMHELKPRTRQNVLLEFGYFIGKLSRNRVCCLYKGIVELPSDMSGIVYIPFQESVVEVRDKIAKELKAAGYEIKI